MSSREPLWFCHECHAEMRPLMVPDPVCASCHSDFVEKMENTADDPRQFTTGAGDLGGGSNIEDLLFHLAVLGDQGMGARNNRVQRPATGPSVTFELRSPNGSRTLRFGGDNTQGGRDSDGSRPRSPDAIPNMSSFIRAPSPSFPMNRRENPFDILREGRANDHPRHPMDRGDPRNSIGGALMAQYLMAMLGFNDPARLGMPENGRMGDYVFNQEALDQIISQIMENSNAHRPVPATEEIIAKLPREVLEEGSVRLGQDCAICKEQFSLKTEDPDEQIVVTLPCKHPFHQPCILPWLTSSGTCPVCRYQLVAQPDQHPQPPPAADGGGNRSPGPSQSPRTPPPQSPGMGAGTGSTGAPNNRGPEPGGLFHSIFSGISGLAHSNQNNNTAHTSAHTSGANSSNAASSSHDPHHSRSWTRPSWAGTGESTRSPRPRSPQPTSHHRTPPHRRSSSGPASPTSHSPPPHGRSSNRSPNSNARSNTRNSNVPGSWEDELD